MAWGRSERVAAPVLARPVVVEISGRIEALQRLPARESVRLLVALDPAKGLPPRTRITIDQDAVPAGLATGAANRLSRSR